MAMERLPCEFSLSYHAYGFLNNLFRLDTYTLHHYSLQEKQCAKRHQNVPEIAGAIVIGFVLCQGPQSVILFLKGASLPCGIKMYHFVAVIMAQLNCAVSPLTCFAFGVNYRQGLKVFLDVTEKCEINLCRNTTTPITFIYNHSQK